MDEKVTDFCDMLETITSELKVCLDSFLLKRTPKAVAVAQIKSLINKGDLNYRGEVCASLSSIVRVLVEKDLNQKFYSSIKESTEFEAYLKNYVLKYNLDSSYVTNYISSKSGLQEILKKGEKLSGILYNALFVKDVLDACIQLKDDDNGVEALLDTLSVIDKTVVRIPAFGSILSVECAIAQKCLDLGADMTIKYYSNLTLPCDVALFLVDDDRYERYMGFNTFLKEKYMSEVGGNFIDELYIDPLEFEKKLEQFNYNNVLEDLEEYFTPTEIFFLTSVLGVFGDYYKKNVKTIDSIKNAMDEYCKQTLSNKSIEKSCDAEIMHIIDQMISEMKDENVGGEGGSTIIGGGDINSEIGGGNIISGDGGSTSGSGSSTSGNGGSTSGSGGNTSGSGGNTSGSGGSTSGSGGSTSGSGGSTSGSGGSTSGSGGSTSGNANSSNGGNNSTSNSSPKDNGDSSFFWDVYNGDFEAAKKATLPVDPIIFDLNHDNVFSSTIEDGVYFDYEGDGFAEKTAWMSEGDGMLVRDLNGNGKIDDGSELFGDRTLLSDGTFATSGFEALNDLDSNKDRVIDASDEKFDELKVWIDKNRDGISQKDELFSLTDIGIKAIHLDKEEITQIDNNKNLITGIAYATLEDGTLLDVGELNFNISTMSSIVKEEVEVSDEIMALPEILSVGKVYSLRAAMMKNPRLKDLIEKFIDVDDRAEKRDMLDEILKEWTGVKNAEYRGSSMDATKLAILEAFYGAEFQGIDGENPNYRAADILNKLYEDLKYYVYANLIFKTECTRYFSEEDVMYNANSENTKINLALFKYLIENDKRYNSEMAKENVEVVAYCLKDTRIYSGDMTISQLLNIFRDDSEFFDCICKGLTKSSYIATSEQTEIIGNSEDNYLKGNQGNNILYGNGGNDILIGGAGNDKLYGGYGDDIYVFGRNTGTDYVYDISGSNTLRFEEGITVEDIRVETVGNNDIMLHIKGGDSKIILSSYRLNDEYKNFILEFADGTKIEAGDINSPIRSIVGTEAGEIIQANYYKGMKAYGEGGNDTINGSVGDDEIHGGTGDDKLNGNTGNDVLDGEEGNDTIYGGAGNDILIGGMGDDKLDGGNGDDIYVFGRNTGTDYVYDISGSNTLRFEEGIAVEDIALEKTGNHLVLFVNNGNTKVILNNYYYSISNRNFSIEFADGSIWGISADYSSLELQSGVNTLLDNEYTIALEENVSITDFDGTDIVNIGENMLNLIFERENDNLNITSSVNGNMLTINDWYSSQNYQIETVTSSDGYEITNKQIQLLIDEMATFSNENGISITEAYANNQASENIVSQMWTSK